MCRTQKETVTTKEKQKSAWPVLVRLLGPVVQLISHVVQEPADVRFEALWRLAGHLNTILQQLDRELWRWRRREDDAEEWMRLLLQDFLDQLFEVGKPLDAQVAIRQQHPES